MSCIVRLYCIVTGRLAGKICIAIQKLYCDSRDSGLLDCVVTQGRDTASQATTRHWAQAGRARSAQAGVRGARWALEHARQAGAQGVRGAGVLGAGLAAWECGLSTGCALGALKLFSIRFDSVLFLS